MKNWMSIFIGCFFAIALGAIIPRINPIVSVFLAFLPMFIFLLPKKEFFVTAPFVFLYSGVLLPGLPGNFQLYHLLCLVFIVWHLFTLALSKSGTKSFGVDSLLIYLMIGWIFSLMFFRGTGFRVFGSDKIGGGGYIHSISALLFYEYTKTHYVRSKSLQIVGILMGLMSIMPMIANGIYEVSGGVLWHQMLLFKAGAAFGETGIGMLQGVGTRLTFLSHGAAFIWIAVFIKTTDKITKKNIILITLAMIFVLFGGYRSSVILLVLFLVIYYYRNADKKGVYLLVLSGLVVLSYILLLMFVRHLPFPIQRIVSMFPGVDADALATFQANSTLEWRREIWGFALNDLPQFIYYGRGISFNPMILYAMDLQAVTSVTAYETGAFHQATLELFVLYGGPFFMLSILFYLYVLIYLFRYIRHNNFYKAYLKDWSWSIYTFVTLKILLAYVGGNHQEILVEGPLLLAFLNLIIRSDHQELSSI